MLNSATQGTVDLDKSYMTIWEFPKIMGTLFWGPYNKDPTM